MNCCPTKSNVIHDLCDLYCLTNLIKEATCHKGTNPSILDIILVSNPRRYAAVLNAECPISDFHNIIGAATKRFAPLKTPRKILYRSYKTFNEIDFINDIESAPFHVMDIFDDVDDMSWFTSTLIRDVIDDHAPIRTKTIKSESVPYMNSCLRKAQYKRNMARNKFRIYGKSYWEENHRHRNNVVKIRKQSMRNYFTNNCSNHEKKFWSTVSPFITEKKFTGIRIFYWQTKMRRFLILNVYQNSLMIILAVWPMGLDLMMMWNQQRTQ